MITEMIQKAIAEALGQGLMPDAGSNAAGSATSLAEPKLKRHKGGGRDPKRKAPEATEPPSGRGAPRAEADSTSGGNRRVVRGKGAGGQPAVLTSVAPAAPADGGWQTVQRRKEEHEPFELRGQDWDVPIVPHDAIGRKLDDLPDGKPLEAVILASKTNLDTEIRGSPAKTVAAWAAEHRVILADSWGWVEETLPKQGKQLFGKARLAEKEMSSLLCCSGRGGIFVDCIRDAIPAQVQWLARIDNEPATAYLERGLRMSAQLGLASQGGRIGARSARDPNAAIPRIWVLPHVPADWGPPEVTQVLTQSFDDITLIHHRRTGREQLYRFRGKHKFGDRDIVPLQVQLEEDGNKNEITMWATIAPVKTPSNKQTWLRNQAVPLIEPKPPALKVTPVKAPQAQAGQESGEAQQPANMRAVSHRQLPDGVRIEEAPKDGSCFYHSMAQGLQWLTGKSFCHRDLRAKANQHIEKHLTEYLPEFDGDPRFGIITFKESRRAKTIALWLTPKHVDLLLPADKDAKYPAELFTPSPGQIIDLRAGGRSSGDAASVCSAVSSAASQWTRASDAVSSARPAQVRSQAPSSRKRPRPEMSQAANQHESDAASIRTGTVWSSVPADSQKPRGKATTGKRTAPKTVWTSHRPPASTSRSVASGGAEATDVEDLHIPEVPAESSAARCRKDRAPDRFRTPQGPDMKYRMLFKCELCPFRATRVGANNMSALKAHHMNTCHDGAGQLPKTDSNQWFANRGKAEDFHWRCPLCRIGIKKVRSEISDSRIFQLQRMHKDQYHPEVSKSKWRVLKKAQKPTDSESRRRRAANLAKSNVKAIRLKLPPHLIPFTMPKAERLQRKGPVAERPITKLRRAGAPLAKFISLLTCNLARKGIATTDAVRAMLSQESVQIAAFQEADINPMSAAGFVAAWRRHHHQAVLSPVDSRGRHRVALTSSLPLRHVQLPDLSCADRVAAGVVVWPLSEGPTSVLVVSFYGYPGDAHRTSAAFESLMSSVATFGGPYVILGDFNITQTEGSLAAMLATGAIRAADDTGGSMHPNTNPTDTRRIDFAVAHPNLVASHVHTFRPGFSTAPAPAEAPDTTPPDPEPEFSALLEAGQLDAAWTFLSDWADLLLGTSLLLCAPFAGSPVAFVNLSNSPGQQQHRLLCLQRWKEKTALSSDTFILLTVCNNRAKSGDLLLRLPDPFWTSLAALWAQVIRSGVRSYLQQDLSAFFDSLSAFYSRQLRLFAVDSYTSERWHRSHHGLLQGPGVEAGIYVDDRLLWFTGQEHSEEEARQALDRSDSFDSAAGLTCSCRKCHLITTVPRCPWRAEAEARGYQIGSNLQFLGVDLCLESGEAVPLKLSLHKLQVRLRHTTNPAFSLEVRRQVIRSLVFPALFWAAGVAMPPLDTLEAIRQSIAAALRVSLTHEVPRVLAGQVLGWTLDVGWVADWSALSALTRTLVQQPEWHEHLSLQELALFRTSSLPGAMATLHRLQWSLDPQSRALERIDDAGRRRTYRLGEDSPAVLKQWLTEAHVVEATHNCGQVQCFCEKLWPSRAHLLWSCPHFEAERSELPFPVDRVEERLLGRPIPEYPPAPATEEQALVPQLLQLFETAASAHQTSLLLATDGSSEHDIGASAVVCDSPYLEMASADSSEDQTPFRMELLAILGVLEALELSAHPPRHVTILVDCESAMKAICCPEASKYCILAARAHGAGAAARRRGVNWQLTWVPSHGKKPGWTPRAPLLAATCRTLNQKADDCANRLRRRRAHLADRVIWHQTARHAEGQEKAIVLLSAKTASFLEAHLCTASE
ncbi:gcs-1 [Symbiodinium sp. KB8]|nr:gcs-1 [Symbiodinium sp. KB8]